MVSGSMIAAAQVCPARVLRDGVSRIRGECADGVSRIATECAAQMGPPWQGPKRRAFQFNARQGCRALPAIARRACRALGECGWPL